MRRRLSIALCTAACLLTSCKMSTEKQEKQDLSKLTDEFVYGSLALSPVSATSAGYHEHAGVKLDQKLDDYSATGIQDQQQFYSGFHDRLAAIKQDQLSSEERADFQILQNQTELALLELREIQSYRHNPTVYVELIGNALFNPFVLEYAPLDSRYRDIIARLSAVPALLDQAKANLLDAPEVWNRVAQEEGDGDIDLIDKALRAKVPSALQADFDRAASGALAALRAFNSYLKTDLSRKTSDWRLGKEKYDKKFAYTLVTGKQPAQVLAEAEAALKDIRDQMAKVASPHSVKEALDKIAQEHATPATFMDQATKDLDEATSFVRQKNLVTLPSRGNLKVIPTPEFMRGIYAVAGFNPAPALEPQLGAFYWVTPIPSNWPKERIESKLREYNRFGLMEITIHEAMPGHYVQFEVADNLQPKSRRVLRNIFGNGPYVEGWATYAQQLMSDEGFLDNSGELRLTLYKQLLRAIANAIIDIRFQTMGMTVQEAMDLMVRDTFQEKEEATAKIQRAQLSSCQLPTYFVGWRGWLDTREAYEKQKGTAFTLQEFHDAALKESAVPMPALGGLLH